MDYDTSKLTTAIEDCAIGEKEALTVKLATERGWSGFRIFPNGNLWAISPEGEGDHVPDYAGILRSAALELLAACEVSANELTEVAAELGDHNVIHDAISRLRAAIAKAKPNADAKLID